MIDDIFVINGVSHCYNLHPENVHQNRWANGVRDMLHGLHNTWNPPGMSMPVEDQATDWSVDTMARTLFLESCVDMAVTHTLCLNSYFKDGLCRREKTEEACHRWPSRFRAYVGVDPTAGLEECKRELDDQMAALPNAVGLKLYPAQANPFRMSRMDDAKSAFPLFERAQEHGLRVVAVHKATPLGPVPLNPFRIDDVEVAAMEFPDINFVIIHGGMGFVEETATALARFPNVYADLEVTTSYLVKAPAMFEKIMVQFVLWSGTSKLIYSDGSPLFHSQPLLEKFIDFQFSEEIQSGYGVSPLTREDKSMILGGNIARLIGIDIDKAKAEIDDDEFSHELKQTGLQQPYSNWRAERSALSGSSV